MIALIIPPGWTLHPGGAHIALPLLKGYLQTKDIQSSLFDLNVGSASFHDARITEETVTDACSTLSVHQMNDAYFSVEDRLGTIAKGYGGKWFAHEGYQHLACDLGDPKSVYEYSKMPSPFTAYFVNQVIPEIRKINPAIVGLSLYVPSQMLTAFEFVRLLRAAGYTGFIALGGNMISRIIGEMKLQWVFNLVDGLIIYQGEEALARIYRVLKGDGTLESVPNLTWRDADGFIRVNEVSLLKPNQFELPDFTGLPHNDYWGSKYFTMVGARGCFYGKCSFCAIPFGWGPKNYIGMSPGAAVVQAMNTAYRSFGVRRFKFIDEALHPKMLREMSAVRDAYAADFEFEGYVRFDPTWASSGFLKLCRDIGLRKAYLGLELAPGETRNVLNKADRADPLAVLKEMARWGIKAHVFCLFGYPGTGIDDAIRTLEFALQHSQYIDTLDIFPFYYAKHTKVDGVRAVDEPRRTWRTEHKYVPDADGVLRPEDVDLLSTKLSAIAWREHPQWLHPIYRMFSPWYDARKGAPREKATASDQRPQIALG